MDKQRSVEGQLSVAYTLCALLGGTASITSGIAWSHWKETLDTCVNVNCSCILYGVNTPSVFRGGYASSCIWVTYGPLIYVLFCVGFACFHGYRVMCGSKPTTRTVMTKNQVGETVILHTVETNYTNSLPRVFWITASVISAFFTVYALIHFSIYLDGFLSTCNQYRKMLEKLLGLNGTIIPVIHDRLACNAIYDFMDYIHPNNRNTYRYGYINTAADLIIGILASLFSWLIFLFVTVLNVRFARIRN